MSSFLQIETLWRFNAKYGPEWLPRYVVYDAAEHLVPVVLAILRAESLSEVPVIGRMIAASERRAHAAGDSSDTRRRQRGVPAPLGGACHRGRRARARPARARPALVRALRSRPLEMVRADPTRRA